MRRVSVAQKEASGGGGQRVLRMHGIGLSESTVA